jgi:3-methyladenine DNA glycosylase/8-oxoguanine DNA glycosylase
MMNIAVPRDFSFVSTVVSHGWYLLAPYRWSRDERALRRPEVLGRSVVDLEITQRDGRLLVGGTIPAAEEARLLRKLGRMFQLDLDMSEFMSIASSSPAHAWVVEARFGRLLCGSTLFEDIVKIIATTNTTWRQTMRMTELLVEKCGRRSKSGRAAFPEPRDIVRFSVDDLKNDCRMGYRAQYVHQLATGIIDGTIDLARISDPAQSTEELFKSYRVLPGIGPYGAAHLVAMDGRHDFIAVDSEFRRFVRERYHKGRTVSDLTLLRRYNRWGRWKYLAYWSELWSSVADRLQPLERGDK